MVTGCSSGCRTLPSSFIVACSSLQPGLTVAKLATSGVLMLQLSSHQHVSAAKSAVDNALPVKVVHHILEDLHAGKLVVPE